MVLQPPDTKLRVLHLLGVWRERQSLPDGGGVSVAMCDWSMLPQETAVQKEAGRLQPG